jgi:hypothetical protein
MAEYFYIYFLHDFHFFDLHAVKMCACIHVVAEIQILPKIHPENGKKLSNDYIWKERGADNLKILRNMLQNTAKYCNLLQFTANSAKYCKILMNTAKK